MATSVGPNRPSIDVKRVGFWSSVLTVVLAVAHFVSGVMTPARSGPFAKPSDIIPYPYTSVSQFVPLDYYWLIPGLLLAPAFMVLMASIYAYALDGKKIFGQIGLSFALVYATIMMINYFVQWTVVVPSLQAGEIAGLSLWTQYNPHGIFITLESLGYMIMSTALLFAALSFGQTRPERTIRWLYLASFVLGIILFVTLPLLGYDIVAFEVSILLVNWIVLIISGILLARLFKRIP